jgi:hypothetical protein
MALPNSTATTSGGEALQTHTPLTGREYEIVMVADESGHLTQSLPTYIAVIPGVAGAAGKMHWDLFNASGSGKLLELRAVYVTPVLTATVTGTLSPDYDLIRTSAAGTGGTALAEAATFPSLSRFDSANAALPAQITMRNAPAGGATSSVALIRQYITQEEAQAGAQLAQWQNILPMTTMAQRFAAREGQGFKLVQNTLGVAQNWTHIVVFTVVDTPA